jgi:single-strand DNA-binding protein
MSQSANKVILIGFLGEAPEVRFSQLGKPVGAFSVRVNESWKDV